MADNTSRLVALMGALRKNMNGAVLDTFRCYGTDYGLNYGVAIHTLRDMAAEQGVDDSFARYLYQQQIRELRIIALWCAEPAKVRTQVDIEYWGGGVINSEVAEQAAQALLCRMEGVERLLQLWCRPDRNPLLAYTALLASSRATAVDADMAVAAIDAVVRYFPDNRLIAQGAIALAASLIKSHRPMIQSLLCSLSDNPTSQLLREEVAWRLEY